MVYDLGFKIRKLKVYIIITFREGITMELYVYRNILDDSSHILRLQNVEDQIISLESICGSAYKNFALCEIYKNNMSMDVFNKIAHDPQIYNVKALCPTGRLFQCSNVFDVINTIVSKYTKQRDTLEKSTIEDIKKYYKECERIIKECLYEQLGKLFAKEKISMIYDKIPNKNLCQDNLLSDYIRAIYNENKEFDLHMCAQKHVITLIQVNYNKITDMLFAELRV